MEKEIFTSVVMPTLWMERNMTIKVFEMFAGYGGASFALKKLNVDFETVGFSEIDKYAIQCYNQNHPNVKNFGDCSVIDPNTLPDFDLLTGGFPCQTFSLAGKREGFNDTRGTLFNHIITIASVKKPKVMILENVKGLLNHDGGKTLRVIKNALHRIGYNVRYKVLNSREFGTPQNRERIWFFCKLGDISFEDFQFPTPKVNKGGLTLQDLLEKDVDQKYYLTQHQLEYSIKHALKRGKPVHKRVNLKYAMCLTTHHPKRAMSDCVVIEDERGIRVLTPREFFRCMGFIKDEINIDGFSDTRAYHIAGNGWEINVASLVIKEALKSLE